MLNSNKCENCGNDHNCEYGSGRFCSSKCARGFSTKAKRSLINEKVSKALTKDPYKKICKNCKKEFTTKKNKQTYCSISCTTSCDILNKQRSLNFKKSPNCGGVRTGAGRGKSGWYKGYWCDSSYELVYVIYNLEHNVKFERNKEGFEYVFENKKYKYYPDFIIDNTYIEIKGYLNKQTEQKIKQFKKPLKVLFKKDIQYMFDYVIEKYSNDFIKLYENNPYKKRKNKCKICNNPAINVYCSRKCSGLGLKKTTR